MRTFWRIGSLTIAALFATALAIDAADARRGGGGGGGMRGGGGFSGGGMRGGGGGGRGFASAGAGRGHVSHPISRPGTGGPGVGNRPGYGGGWGNRPGYGGGWGGYRPGYGWGAAAAAGAVGAGLAYGSGYGYSDPYYGSYGYNSADVSSAGMSDPVAECARRFKTYDPASQTYIRRPGERASCP
jgi:hypothetical protein